jgi:hypothetical protein
MLFEGDVLIGAGAMSGDRGGSNVRGGEESGRAETRARETVLRGRCPEMSEI